MNKKKKRYLLIGIVSVLIGIFIPKPNLFIIITSSVSLTTGVYLIGYAVLSSLSKRKNQDS